MLDHVGDLGGEFAPDRMLSSRRLEERAVRERWPMSAEERSRIISRLLRTIDADDAGHREATSAAKALIAADRINVQVEQGDLAERVRALEEADGKPAGEGRATGEGPPVPQDRG